MSFNQYFLHYTSHALNLSAAADVVPAEEYDELSKLVDRLLTEKAQLQLTVDKQGDQLKVPYVLCC